ncbi:MAG: Ferric siderophore transport system, periplasmic binding protein TonB [uncultured Lysobacter sp.]|uniref:Ferric siderophore transport system, periplasmic binding protein TonB n=1 Tax=uncultured Lysobacter sp. TaxID=271060 RepID=A0A6J4LI37_9GAMM|nr:MAG: Ferric siderophore transport system, periplasmic binding protein TonB [uncultured Lysobacter sp.]
MFFNAATRGCGIAAIALTALIAGCGEAPPQAPHVPPTPPKARDTPPPAYPELLACQGIGGRVVLMLQVGPDGVPGDTRVKQRSAHAEFDAAALAAVRNWRFAPATAAGKPVATKIQVPVTFTPPTIKPDACFALEEKQRRAAGG